MPCNDLQNLTRWELFGFYVIKCGNAQAWKSRRKKLWLFGFLSVGVGIFAPKCGKLAKNGTCKIL